MNHFIGLLLILSVVGCVNDPEPKLTLSELEVEEEVVENLLTWHYDDEFKAHQKEIFVKWIKDVHEACVATLGRYPFEMNVHFHKSNNKTVPVSFGHTRRNKFNELHFYVNPNASYDELIHDWTAQHEMSHHSIPFVGEKYKWFAEGYATYMSRRIMITQGFYTEAEFDTLYLNNIIDKKRYYADYNVSFSEASADLFKKHHYGPVYWAGAGFFYRADKQLQEKHNIRMSDVIESYQNCCRVKDKNYKSIIISFDRIINDNLFQTLSDQYCKDPCIEVMAKFN